MTDSSQPDDLAQTPALVDQARLEAQMRVAEVDTEETRGAGKAAQDAAVSESASGAPTENEDADPVGDASRVDAHL